jgi:hypothetical protein
MGNSLFYAIESSVTGVGDNDGIRLFLDRELYIAEAKEKIVERIEWGVISCELQKVRWTVLSL